MKKQLCHLLLDFILQTAHLVKKLREIEDNIAFQFSYLSCQTVLIIQTDLKMKKQNQQRKTEPTQFPV